MSVSSPPRTAIPWYVAAMPLYTGGLLAPVPFLYAAAKLRLARLWLIAGAYVAVWLIPWVVLAVIGTDNDAVDTVGHRLALALALGGTVHAFVLRRSLSPLPHASGGVVGQQQHTIPAPPAVSDPTQTSCAEVRAALSPLKYSMITHADLFPAGCRELVDETVAHMERVVAFAANGGQADAALRTVHAIATDYLPTSINTYVRLPCEYAMSHRHPNGRTASEELELELRVLRDKVEEAVESLHRHDALRLEQQTAFLLAKFGKSELDLP
jgi:hypothetical protein